jgi:hypothetical protein
VALVECGSETIDLSYVEDRGIEIQKPEEFGERRGDVVRVETRRA